MYLRISTFAALLLGSATFAVAQPPIEELRNLASSLESAIRSQSEASNRPSMAMIDRETARSMNYDNQLKHVRTYFEKRQLNRNYRQAERLPRRTSAQITAATKRSLPDRLTSQQYEPYGGYINWPVVLRDAEYQEQRQQVDKLFAAHAKAGGGINTTYYASIQSTLTKMSEQLSGNYSTTNTDQFIYARKFLASLQYEARMPVGS